MKKKFLNLNGLCTYLPDKVKTFKQLDCQTNSINLGRRRLASNSTCFITLKLSQTAQELHPKVHYS